MTKKKMKNKIYYNVSITRPSSLTNNSTSNKTYILGTTIITKLTLNIQRLHHQLNRKQRKIVNERYEADYRAFHKHANCTAPEMIPTPK